MGKKKFNKKQTVRFVLVPGVDENGNPDNKFKPVETPHRGYIPGMERIVNEIAEFEEIEINGKVVSESEIPAYILDQIRGRADLIYNERENLDEEEMEEDMEEEWEDEEWEDMPDEEYE